MRIIDFYFLWVMQCDGLSSDEGILDARYLKFTAIYNFQTFFKIKIQLKKFRKFRRQSFFCWPKLRIICFISICFSKFYLLLNFEQFFKYRKNKKNKILKNKQLSIIPISWAIKISFFVVLLKNKYKRH